MSTENTATVIDFIEYFSEHISNFKPTFKARLNKTYIFDQYLSNCFGQAVSGDSCHLLVPIQFFHLFESTAWVGAYYIEGKPGIYLTFKTKNNIEESVTIALRVYVRSKRVTAMGRFEALSVTPYVKEDDSIDTTKSFQLNLESIKTLFWEKQ